MLQYLEMYQPTFMESQIVEMYRKNHIRSPQDISMEMFAEEASIWMHYAAVRTTYHVHDNGMYSIIIDDRVPEQQQRIELAHELGHVLFHSGNQMTMRVEQREKQEWEADRFANRYPRKLVYLAVPFYMSIDFSTRPSKRPLRGNWYHVMWPTSLSRQRHNNSRRKSGRPRKF